MTSKARRIATASALLVLGLPAAAHAGTASVVDGRLVLDAAGDYIEGEVFHSGSEATLYDYTGILTLGDGCEEAAPDPLAALSDEPGGQYTCSGVTAGVELAGGAQGDYLYAEATAPITLRGAGGDDYLTVYGAPARLEGADGDDYLRGGAQADVLDAGPGRDLLSTGGGDDSLSGGDGRDTLQADTDKAVTVALAGIGVEVVLTGYKDDVVTGDERFNEITTADGKDTVDPGGGSDLVDAGADDDTINARDGAVDDIVCGEGADRVVADPDDFAGADCETVERAALPVAAAPGPPATTLQLQARWRRNRLLVSGRVLPASGCEGGGITVSVAGLGKRVRKVGTTLRRDCTFAVRIRGKGRRARVSASFAGTPSLSPAAAAPVSAARRSR